MFERVTHSFVIGMGIFFLYWNTAEFIMGILKADMTPTWGVVWLVWGAGWGVRYGCRVWMWLDKETT